MLRAEGRVAGTQEPRVQTQEWRDGGEQGHRSLGVVDMAGRDEGGPEGLWDPGGGLQTEETASQEMGQEPVAPT